MFPLAGLLTDKICFRFPYRCLFFLSQTTCQCFRAEFVRKDATCFRSLVRTSLLEVVRMTL